MARITVVNDYPDFVELMTSVLDEMVGHQVIGLESSETTIDDLVEARPDLLIVDIQAAEALLPGISTTRNDRAAAALSRAPMIVCSGDVSALQEFADEFGDLGNVHTLEKPFTLDRLTDLVEDALYRAALSPVA